jgi:hypothetical protein
MEMRGICLRARGGNGLQASIHLRIVSYNYLLVKQYLVVIRMMDRNETGVWEVARFEGVAGAADSNELWKSVEKYFKREKRFWNIAGPAPPRSWPYLAG